MKKEVSKSKHSGLVIGNWKMNPETKEKALTLVSLLKKTLKGRKGNTEVLVAPPFPFIYEVGKVVTRTSIGLATQNIFFEEKGAFTGEVSVSMVRGAGVSRIIVGHSEVRKLGETDEVINQKILKVLQSGLSAVLCVGEKSRDAQGDYFGTVESQLRKGLKGVMQSRINKLVIAYEPVWAIGTGKNATPEDVQEMKLFIQKILTELFERSGAKKIKILYGGSVTKDNAEELHKGGETDGFLVGGASLKAPEFAEIIKIVDSYAR